MSLNKYASNLLSKLDVVPFFDLVVREGNFDFNETLTKHKEIFLKTEKLFLLVHSDDVFVQILDPKELLDVYGCIGVVAKKELKQFLMDIKENMHFNPDIKDELMEPRRNAVTTGRLLKGSKSVLRDVKFALSGTLKYWDRKEFMNLVDYHGGVYSSSVTEDTDYLVVGYDSGKTKCKMAKLRGLETLTEKEFVNMVNVGV